LLVEHVTVAPQKRPHTDGAAFAPWCASLGFGAPALATTLFGGANRWGKLPVTLYPHSFVFDNPMDNMEMA
jgi:hypothetical protein